MCGGGGDDTIFTDDFIGTPEVEGAWQALWDYKAGGHETHIISKCGKLVEGRSMLWLNHHGFFANHPMHRTHFVRKRELKAPMAQALELDIFIDDRQDVLDPMEGIVKHRILFTSWEQTNKELEKILDRPSKG